MKKIALRGHVTSVESARSEADNCLGPGRSTENRSLCPESQHRFSRCRYAWRSGTKFRRWRGETTVTSADSSDESGHPLSHADLYVDAQANNQNCGRTVLSTVAICG
jgi:hypothetical protein